MNSVLRNKGINKKLLKNLSKLKNNEDDEENEESIDEEESDSSDEIDDGDSYENSDASDNKDSDEIDNEKTPDIENVISKLFDLYDEDGSGVIEEDEFRSLLKDLYKQMDFNQPTEIVIKGFLECGNDKKFTKEDLVTIFSPVFKCSDTDSKKMVKKLKYRQSSKLKLEKTIGE